MKKYLQPSLLVLCLLSSACNVNLKPVHMDTNPNERDRNQASEQIEQGNIEAFIAEHPDLDDETKRQLRAGIITRPEALDRLKKKK